MKKILFLFCLVIGSVCLANTVESKAQIVLNSDCEISVVDENGNGISDVLILEQDSGRSTSTDESGNASLSCSEDAILSFSHPEYEAVEISRENQSKITVVMPSN